MDFNNIITQIKLILGKEWKLLLFFISIAVIDLSFSWWVIELISFIANLLLIGYIVFATNNKSVLTATNKLYAGFNKK